MTRLVIEKRDAYFFVQHNENSFECQRIADALISVINSEHLDKISECVDEVFTNLEVRSIILAKNLRWYAIAELDDNYVVGEHSDPSGALFVLYKAAQKFFPSPSE
jgi:hypothetical protein